MMAATAEAPRKLHPFCRICGWRKGGVDSWDGVACKCGESAPPLAIAAGSPADEAIAASPMQARGSIVQATDRARTERLRKYSATYFPLDQAEVDRPFEWRGIRRDPKAGPR